MSIVKPPSAAAQNLPVDLDGDHYRSDDLGPWKVTPCCGAYVKGGDVGVYCRGCYENMDHFPDGPARLAETDPKVAPAIETAIVITLPEPDVSTLPLPIGYDEGPEQDVVNVKALYPGLKIELTGQTAAHGTAECWLEGPRDLVLTALQETWGCGLRSALNMLDTGVQA